MKLFIIIFYFSALAQANTAYMKEFFNQHPNLFKINQIVLNCTFYSKGLANLVRLEAQRHLLSDQ